MATVLIVSLNFNPGHVSHLVASYRQMEELGYEPLYYVNEAFIPYLPNNGRVSIYGKDTTTNVLFALFLFPSEKNLFLIRKLKKQGSRIIYIFHEPLAPIGEYRRAGFSYKYLAKLWAINRISSLTVKWSDAVIVPSKKAEDYYHSNPLYQNESIYYLPLLFDDERRGHNVSMHRLYFGYIGTVAADHSFSEFIQFVEMAIIKNRLPELKFLIATKSEFEVPQVLAESSRVVIKKGRPLSDEEINECYASSFVVWNAYARTTQSGVLAKCFMFATPAILLRKNLSEFAEDGHDVVAINDNTSFKEIEWAVNHIINDFARFSKNARRRFETTFYYRNYNNQFKDIINSILP